MNKVKDELVFHPSHYNVGGRKECWTEMEELFGPGAVAIFDCLSAYKYLYRKGEKADNSAEQDLAKVENYVNHAAKELCMNTGKDITLGRHIFRTLIDYMDNNAYFEENAEDK